METKNEIDLSKCVAGQRLISKHGKVMVYVGPFTVSGYDHEIAYSNGSRGTRTNDGFVFKKNRKEADHDVAEIIPMRTYKNYTQEEVRLQIAEMLKDCTTDEFMAVTKTLFPYRHPVLQNNECDRGFRIINMEE